MKTTLKLLRPPGDVSTAARRQVEEDLDLLKKCMAELKDLAAAGRNGTDPKTMELHATIGELLGPQAPRRIRDRTPGWEQAVEKAIPAEEAAVGALGAPTWWMRLRGKKLRFPAEGPPFDAAKEVVADRVQFDDAGKCSEEDFLARAREFLRPAVPAGATMESVAFLDPPEAGPGPELTIVDSADGMLALSATMKGPSGEPRPATLRLLLRFPEAAQARACFGQLERACADGTGKEGSPKLNLVHGLSALLHAWLRRPRARAWEELMKAIAAKKIDGAMLAHLAEHRASLRSLPAPERDVIADELPGIADAAAWDDVTAYARCVVGAVWPTGPRRAKLAETLCARAEAGTIEGVWTILNILAEVGRGRGAERYARELAVFVQCDQPAAQGVHGLLALIAGMRPGASGFRATMESTDEMVARELAVAAKRQELEAAFGRLAPVARMRWELEAGGPAPAENVPQGTAPDRALLAAAAEALAAELPAPAAGVWQTAVQQAVLLAALTAFIRLRGEVLPRGTSPDWDDARLVELEAPLPRDLRDGVERYPAGWWILLRAWLRRDGVWPVEQKCAYALEVADGLFMERWRDGGPSLAPVRAWLEDFLGGEAGRISAMVAGRWLHERPDGADERRHEDRLHALVEWGRWADGSVRGAALRRRWRLPAGAPALGDRWRACLRGSFLDSSKAWKHEWIALLWQERLAAGVEPKPWDDEIERWDAGQMSTAAWDTMLAEAGGRAAPGAGAGAWIDELAAWGGCISQRAGDLQGWRKLFAGSTDIPERTLLEFYTLLLQSRLDAALRAVAGFWPKVPARYCREGRAKELARFLELSSRLGWAAGDDDTRALAVSVAQQIKRDAPLDERIRIMWMLGRRVPGTGPALARDHALTDGVLEELVMAGRKQDFLNIEGLGEFADEEREAVRRRVARRVVEKLERDAEPDPKPLAFIAWRLFPARAKAWKSIAAGGFGLPATGRMRLARCLFTTPGKDLGTEYVRALLHEARMAIDAHQDLALGKRLMALAEVRIQ